MAKLAYFASQIPGKETWFQTPEGYRIYKNVPICRTGMQQYYGRELKGNKGYDPSWGLDDNTLYDVYRPLEEVTSPETIASYEGKSVLDEHPSGDRVLIDALDELDGISKGHGHNIRVGEQLADGEFAGETPLIADLTVKHPELNEKIEAGIRDVSCGYAYLLARRPDGQLIQTKIRGNHHAVVPRGRAGPDIAIGDAAPHTPNEKRTATMSFSSRIARAMGFQSWAKDAKPEEVADALESIEREGAEKDAEEDHVKGCKCDDCMPDHAKDKKSAKDKAAKDFEEPEKKEAEEKEAKKAADKAAKDAEEEDEEDRPAKDEEEEEKSAKDEAEILPADEVSESEFSVGDALAQLKEIRPAIARSKNPKQVKAYNTLTENLRKVRDGVKDGSVEDPFVSLVNVGSAAADAAAVAEPSMLDFFSGRSYADGVKAYNEFLASKGAK